MVTVNALKRKNNKNENKMHFTCLRQCWQAFGTFKLHLKELDKNFRELVTTKRLSTSSVFFLRGLFNLLSEGSKEKYIFH
jgi:hypothetical protein